MKKKLQWLSIFIGLILAAAIVFVQFFQFQNNGLSKKDVKTEQQDSKSSDEELQVSLPTFSLPSQIHVSVNLDAVCLFEIVFEEKEENKTSLVSTLIPQKFLITLFRVIISPNAP